MTGDRKPVLDGIVVLDFTMWLSGPFTTQMLADMGARVIKVEGREGDGTRPFPPYFDHDDSAYFHAVNRSKESIVVDLKSPGGKAIVDELAAHADIVVENFRPGVAKRLGVDYERLSKTNPRLIGCSVSGFGQDGPYRDKPAYDMVVQAMAGVMSLTGEQGRRPVRCGIPVGDVVAGMYGVIGILAALAVREKTGLGDYVDISMLDAQVSMLSYLGVYHLLAGIEPGPQGRGHLSIPTYRSFLAGDGREILITANTEKMWQSLVVALGAPELGSDPRFTLNADRLRNQDQLLPLLDARFATRASAEWVSILEAADVPVAPVNSVADALSDPQVLDRNMVIEVEYPDGATSRLIGNPVKFEHAGAPVPRPAPRLAANTSAVLRDVLGYSEQQVADAMASGAVA